jgi:hypothetical protein
MLSSQLSTSSKDPEYYTKEVKRLKVKVRRVYNKRKFGGHYQAELKRLSKELLIAKKKAQETFLSSVLQNEGGQSFISMLKDVKVIEKIFLRSRALMEISSPYQ